MEHKDTINDETSSHEELIEENTQEVELEAKKELSAEEMTCQEQLIRTRADFENFKRRVQAERAIWSHQAQASVLFDVFPLIDDLQRAIEAGKQEEALQNSEWFSGVLLINKNIFSVLEKLAIKKIDCSGQFDPSLHEALMQVDSADHASGDIVQVLQDGYLFKDKVLRHAKVSVAK